MNKKSAQFFELQEITNENVDKSTISDIRLFRSSFWGVFKKCFRNRELLRFAKANEIGNKIRYKG